MRTIEPGQTGHYEIVTDATHTAAAVGNPGVDVVSTTALILFLEHAAHAAVVSTFEPGEGSVGTRVDVEHVAGAKAGTRVVARATVSSVEGRRVGFDVQAFDGTRLLMRGRHQRVVVHLERFLAKQGLA